MDKKTIQEKNFALYQAVVIWDLQRELYDIFHKVGSDGIEKYNLLEKHMCDIDSSRLLMDVIKHYFPEMYKEEGKSIQQHFEEAEKYLKSQTVRLPPLPKGRGFRRVA